MEVIALGKFENKLSEAGVVGGFSKAGVFGVHFFTNLQPRQTTEPQPQVPSSSSKSYSLFPPPLLTL